MSRAMLTCVESSWRARHAIQYSLKPKKVYNTVAACCVASRDIRLGKT